MEPQHPSSHQQVNATFVNQIYYPSIHSICLMLINVLISEKKSYRILAEQDTAQQLYPVINYLITQQLYCEHAVITPIVSRSVHVQDQLYDEFMGYIYINSSTYSSY